uniref:Uncharacterized protein n=1 Tax=Oryza brachyantha TaxID=4533 RepID=J3LHA7_ORYBR
MASLMGESHRRMYCLLRIIFHLRANHYCCVVSQNPKLPPIINNKQGVFFITTMVLTYTFFIIKKLHFRSLAFPERLATM